MEIPKTYSPDETEKPWYPFWEEKGYFAPKSGEAGPPYAIVIPPPNVTGSLHMGHALNNTLQDVLTRWHRMRGDRTVWVPGTDHGGIATQNVVEKLLRAEKKTRNDLGREKFLERMWQWRRESGDTILMQLRRLGSSLDWSRTRFTMDDECSRAVRTAFVRLFKKGLIYRGLRMTNWCPRCQTALADIEVEHEDRAGKLWHIRYPLADGSGAITVATTRPETMIGDTAVAVNPEDPRYLPYIGKMLQLPLTERQIRVIADAAVDPAFGTGAVKVTPSHDATDFEMGERHQLPHVVVIGFDGKMTEKAGRYASLDRFEARKQIVADLETGGLIEKVEDHRLPAAICYRCQTIIEPLVSEQWFMKMKDMAARAAQATRDGRVKIFPSSWEKPYLLWLDNIRDWCISRQIWWGHRIPVWYCPNAKAKGCAPIASESTPDACPACGAKELTQDNDVLDTWFSSGLWPLSVFGWPDETADLKTFYPTSVLVTGHEILYLWVARMVMMGLEFKDEVPFRHVYIHGIVRDKQGKKMSKSLGNVIDPLEIMKQYGTDALRFALASSSVPGRDMQLSNDSFLKARNFANKLWNATRFVMTNLEGYKPGPLPAKDALALADRWILHDLQETKKQVAAALESYNPAEACRALYEFVWGSYCDWYLEMAKPFLLSSDAQARVTKQAVLVHVLDEALRLLHPVMPFETEALYQALRPSLAASAESIMIAPWPAPEERLRDATAAAEMTLVQDAVRSIRTLRSEMRIKPGLEIDCYIKPSDAKTAALLAQPNVNAAIFFLAGRRKDTALVLADGKTAPRPYFFNTFAGGEVYLPAGTDVDLQQERARLEKRRGQLQEQATRGRTMLENPDFQSRAPKEEIDARRATLADLEQQITWIQRNLEGLS